MPFHKTLLLAATALSSLALSAADDLPDPIQSLFVPIPEEELLDDIFEHINSVANGPVRSLISIAMASDNTIIYFDHWEDGYDSDPKGANEIWGDGDCSNGYPPIFGDGACVDGQDVLNAGDVVVMENDVSIPRVATQVVYDGGDLLKASKPIAMTRAAYPATPGSLMAGAIEVYEVSDWGTTFEAPVGEDLASDTNAYQFVACTIMAGTDGTTVYINGAPSQTLAKGGSTVIEVNQGDKITTSNPVQVHLITGDVGSSYELRWYALTPLEQWGTEYYAPVGDTEGATKITIYNPSNSQITVSVTTPTANYGVDVPAGSSAVSEVLPNGEAGKFESSSTFFAFSSTDTKTSTVGEIFDWGYPLMTREQLTNVALIGLGYGCTDNDCDSNGERSVVWVTPVADADIYVDYNQDGNYGDPISASALEGIVLKDASDQDMSGSIIWATEPGTGSTGPGVDIAAAWGQKAAFSGFGDSDALDLGTVIIPFEPVRTSCSVALINDNDGDGQMSVGDDVQQTIEVVNAGPTAISGGSLVLDTLNGPVTVDATGAQGGTQTYVVDYTIPEGEVVTETCEILPYVPPPTDSPTGSPTKAPTDSPTKAPTKAPTDSPTKSPTTDAPTKAPTDGPTASTATPTGAPTKAPTDSPSEAPTRSPVQDKTFTKPPVNKGSSSGDPHFKTWTGDKFDYHGECDLVLVDNPSFNNGQGLRLHVRTTRVKYFSFIERAALQIGDDILEFANDVENFLINGVKVEANKKHHKTLLGGFVARRDRKAISIRLADGTGLHQKMGAAKIDFHTRKNGFPAVIVDGGATDIFSGSLGLLGEWGTGKKMARDGKTEIAVNGVEDESGATAFALEWQVRDTEPTLFQDPRIPQFPTTCTPPAQRPRGRLGDSLFRKEAEEACSHWQEDMDDCIFDVMATRDVFVAQEGHVIHIQ